MSKNHQLHNSDTPKWTNSEEYDRINLWQPAIGTSKQKISNRSNNHEKKTTQKTMIHQN